MLKLKEVNVNHKNKKTTDCVVRAIAMATNKDYKEVAKELFEVYLKTGYAMNDRKCYEKLELAMNTYKSVLDEKVENKSELELLQRIARRKGVNLKKHIITLKEIEG